MVQNNINTLIATPVYLEVEIGPEKKPLCFRRISIRDRQLFHARWGKEEYEKRLANFDEEIISSILYHQLTTQDKHGLKDLKKYFIDIDENGKEFSLAETPLEIFQLVISADLETYASLLMQIAGLGKKTMSELDKLSNKKKDELITELTKQITPQSSPGSSSTQAGQ